MGGGGGIGSECCDGEEGVDPFRLSVVFRVALKVEFRRLLERSRTLEPRVAPGVDALTTGEAVTEKGNERTNQMQTSVATHLYRTKVYVLAVSKYSTIVSFLPLESKV